MDWKREPRSHIRADGVPKIAYETLEAAQESARMLTTTHGRGYMDFEAYQCSQNPPHWHVGEGNRDLMRTQRGGESGNQS